MLSLRAVGRSPYVRAAVTPGFHLGVPRAGRKRLGGGVALAWKRFCQQILLNAPPNHPLDPAQEVQMEQGQMIHLHS